MGDNSAIEWTQATWNPVTGCTKISPGCSHCYAERLARRLQAMGNPRYSNGFRVTLQPDILDLPRKWARPRVVFVNSMSDLFHAEVPLDYIRQVFDVMAGTPHHTYQILTKRAERLSELSRQIAWPDNVWMGVSVENTDYSWRIEYLRSVPAAVRFLSLEPLLGPIDDLDLGGIHWVIVGGESGPGARPISAEWVRSIRNQCIDFEVAFFFKQWGGVQKHRTGRILDGATWDQMPSSRSPLATLKP